MCVMGAVHYSSAHELSSLAAFSNFHKTCRAAIFPNGTRTGYIYNYFMHACYFLVLVGFGLARVHCTNSLVQVFYGEEKGLCIHGLHTHAPEFNTFLLIFGKAGLPTKKLQVRSSHLPGQARAHKSLEELAIKAVYKCALFVD